MAYSSAALKTAQHALSSQALADAGALELMSLMACSSLA